MPALIFDKCCRCIDLKTGCLIIGYVELVLEIILSILVLMLMISGSVVMANNNDEAKAAGAAVLAVGVILLLFIALLLAFTIVLLVGIYKNKRGHVKAYLIYSAIFLVIGLITFFASFSRSVGAGYIVFNIGSLLLHAYFLLVIRSYYYRMNDTNKGAIYNTA